MKNRQKIIILTQAIIRNSLAWLLNKTMAHPIIDPLPTRPDSLGLCQSLSQHSIDLRAVYSRLDPFFVNISSSLSIPLQIPL